MKKYLAFFVWLLFVPNVFATTYYVSTTGDNADPGTEAEPWLTIQKCADTINAGDTCIVKDGTYTENVSWSRAGSSGNQMTLQAENQHSAVISGKITLTTSASYITIDGIKINIPDGTKVGISVAGNGSYHNIKNNYITTVESNSGLDVTGIDTSYTSSYLTIDNNFVSRTCFGSGFSGSYSTLSNNEFTLLKKHSNCGDVDYVRAFGTSLTISNNNFHGIDRSETGSAHVDGVQTFDTNNKHVYDLLIENNYIQSVSEGVQLTAHTYALSSGVVIRGNVFTSTTAWCGSTADIDDVHFINNTCDTTGGIQGFHCGGPTTVNCEFKNNIIYRVDGAGNYYYLGSGGVPIDGTASAPGKNNLLYRVGFTIPGGSFDGDILNLDPLFFDRAAGNYRLREASPAIDNGLAIVGPSPKNEWVTPDDYDGTARDNDSGWDVGAFEYIDSDTTPQDTGIVPWGTIKIQ